jgi:thioredoxin-dependent peroxiredoxin
MKATKTLATGKKSATREKAKAATLSAGQAAPVFSLPDDAGNEVSLRDFGGKWLVLYFYPRDSTPGCTREACAFRDQAAAFKRAGAVVVGVSRDSVESHVKFKAAQKLGFPLLSDREAKVHKAYGAYGDKMMYGKKITGALRTTVLVAPDGKVARVFPSVKVDGHADQVLSALREEAAAAR